MNINEIYQSNSNYLKAQDLPPGREIKVIIESYEISELDGKPKIVLKFIGKDKTLVLNKTNASTIAHVYGNDADEWISKEIILFSTKVDYAGQMVDAIRVRVIDNSIPDDGIPFDDF